MKFTKIVMLILIAGMMLSAGGCGSELVPVSVIAYTMIASKCTTHRSANFNEAEYAPYVDPGTGKVIGQAFLRTRKGDFKYGSSVLLIPVTTYSTEWFQGVTHHVYLEPADSRENKYFREVLTDEEGRFEFENLPEGSYYLISKIYWREFPTSSGHPRLRGGVACSTAKVKNGETIKTDVTRYEYHWLSL